MKGYRVLGYVRAVDREALTLLVAASGVAVEYEAAERGFRNTDIGIQAAKRHGLILRGWYASRRPSAAGRPISNAENQYRGNLRNARQPSRRARRATVSPSPRVP